MGKKSDDILVEALRDIVYLIEEAADHLNTAEASNTIDRLEIALAEEPENKID